MIMRERGREGGGRKERGREREGKQGGREREGGREGAFLLKYCDDAF